MSKDWKNPYSPYSLAGKPFTVAETVRRVVYLLGKGDEVEGTVFKVEVQDMAARDDRGQPVPPVVVIMCPRCNKGLRIDGFQKGVHMDYFDAPKKLDLRSVGLGIVEQTGILSVHESMRCPHVGSDAPCGFRFKITENVLHKVG